MLKKTLAAILAACMITAIFAGCKKKEEIPAIEPESASAEESSTPPTQAEAEENNKAITDADVNLVQFVAPKTGDKIATMKTSEGTIRLLLFPEQAPKSVENFIGLSEKGYYNGVIFHRVINDFVIQGGDPTGTGMGGESIYSTGPQDRGEFENEPSLDLWHFRGALAMANAGPNTNGSQFYIVQNPQVPDATLEEMAQVGFPPSVVEKYAEVGGTPPLDQNYTVFGMVLDNGMEVVDKIAKVKTESEKPVEPVIIEEITIETVK